MEKGVIPVTPHIYLTQFMDDNVPEERELALKIGSELVLGCSELWAFGTGDGWLHQVPARHRVGNARKGGRP